MDIAQEQDIPLFPPGQARLIQRALTGLRRDTVARCVLLVDWAGRPVAEAGSAQGEFLSAALPVLAEEIALVSRLGQRWREGAVLSLHHYEGGQNEVYAASSADLPYLLVTLTWQRPPAYSGVIWLFVRRTMQELRRILSDGASGVDGLTLEQAQALGLLAEPTEDEEQDASE